MTIPNDDLNPSTPDPDVPNNDPSPEVVLAAVQGLSKYVNTLSNNVGSLASTTTTNRRYIRMLAISLVFDICLSFGLGFATYKANEASHKANRAADALALVQKSSCIAGNTTRGIDLNLWDFVLDLPVTQPRTDDQRKEVAQLRAYVIKAFGQRAC